MRVLTFTLVEKVEGSDFRSSYIWKECSHSFPPMLAKMVEVECVMVIWFTVECGTWEVTEHVSNIDGTDGAATDLRINLVMSDGLTSNGSSKLEWGSEGFGSEESDVGHDVVW